MPTHYCADQTDDPVQQIVQLKGKLDGFLGQKVVRIERIERTPAPPVPPADAPTKGWRVEVE